VNCGTNNTLNKRKLGENWIVALIWAVTNVPFGILILMGLI